MYSSSAKTYQRPNFFFFDYGEDKTAAEIFFFALREDKTAPPISLTHTAKTKKRTPFIFFAFGDLKAATIPAPECGGPKTPFCGKPYMAFGECCGKWQFRPKCCASATAQQLTNALDGSPAAGTSFLQRWCGDTPSEVGYVV